MTYNPRHFTPIRLLPMPNQNYFLGYAPPNQTLTARDYTKVNVHYFVFLLRLQSSVLPDSCLKKNTSLKLKYYTNAKFSRFFLLCY